MLLTENTSGRKASGDEEASHSHKMKCFIKREKQQKSFIWNVSAYVLNLKTLCRRKARKQDFAEEFRKCGNVFVAGEFNYKSFPVLPYAYATFLLDQRVVQKVGRWGGGGGGEVGRGEGGGVKILFLM